ncbi:hypothetical protein DEO23_14575 [Brachybacterium endophyticum]|uniref:Uncharacterized protein n=1 Tax=Brachybacterium endophyticum TaxID=2182385 RepID=A0A2U2RHG1_9MICO|nr:hypothetical protein [Brachybacterium endophyticum]PWH05288.1 hypothetical protein DEO23_14575 [Brachybacterium endophyticum]
MGGFDVLGLGGWEPVILAAVAVFWILVALVAYWLIRSAVRAGTISAHRYLARQARPTGPPATRSARTEPTAAEEREPSHVER